MSSKFWRQMIFAEGILLLGIGLGWLLSPHLGKAGWFSTTVVMGLGISLILGFFLWQRSKSLASQVKGKARLGTPVSLESLRKALRAHGIQPDLVKTPYFSAALSKVQNTQTYPLEALSVLTLLNEGPDLLRLELEEDVLFLEADSWIRIGPFENPALIRIQLAEGSKQSFVLSHLHLLSVGLD